MKKRDVILIILLSALSIFSFVISFDITGKIITGEALQYFSMNITVTGAEPPTLSLINPKNKTYVNNQSIPLTYIISNEESIWYSLDSGTNITLSSPTNFNVSEGSHTIFLYANNSNGESSQNVTFFVNSEKFKMNNSKYTGDKKGDSTNLSDYSYEELQDISDLILEHSDFGKIKFNENINITDDSDFTDSEINFDDYTNISSNRIEINSSALPNFNKSATLLLYGLSFSTPRILKDGAVCPSTICTQESYSGGILKFNVTSFSVYSSEETPVAPPVTPVSPGGGGGSGGGAIIKQIKSFTVDSDEINIALNPGSITTKKFIITNELNKKIDISLIEENLGDFIIINEPQFELGPLESKEISFDIVIREEVIPDLYVGKLIVKNGITTEEILLMIEIEHKEALFDLRVNIPDEYMNVLPDKEILAEIELFNLGLVKRADVEIEYAIEDSDGNKVMTEKETIAVETKVSFIKRIRIPSETGSGKHILYIKAVYNEKFASATASFNVIKWEIEKLFILILLLSIILISSIIYIYLKQKEERKNPIQKKLVYRI